MLNGGGNGGNYNVAVVKNADRITDNMLSVESLRVLCYSSYADGSVYASGSKKKKKKKRMRNE